MAALPLPTPDWSSLVSSIRDSSPLVEGPMVGITPSKYDTHKAINDKLERLSKSDPYSPAILNIEPLLDILSPPLS